MQKPYYCDHFDQLKSTKIINLSKDMTCKLCAAGKNYLWLCLTKNCEYLFCDMNDMKHIQTHFQQSKSNKQFHSIFINILTAKIICICCHIQILDLEHVKVNKSLTLLKDPFPFRLKVLPSLSIFNSQKSKQNPEGHKKISKALTGFFGNKSNYAMNSALQFLMQIEFFRQIMMCIKPVDSEIEKLSVIMRKAEEADFRAIQTDELFALLAQHKPDILGYSRKDPFDIISYFIKKVHQIIKYYKTSETQFQFNEWDLVSQQSNNKQLIEKCPLYDNIAITLLTKYQCQKCQRQQSHSQKINYLNLQFPRKKRKVQQIQKQLTKHRLDSSPLKKRRRSLSNLFKMQQDFPFTLSQLILEYFKHPSQKDKICIVCKNSLNKIKVTLDSLPQYLIIQINRMGNDNNSLDQTKIQFTTNEIDLGSFVEIQGTNAKYKFETSICIENACSYPVVAINKYNNRHYIFKNELVTMLQLQKDSLNPYIICYKKVDDRDYVKLKDCYLNVKSNVQILRMEQNQGVALPDFWLCQLKVGIAKRLQSQFICVHHKLKSNVSTKMNFKDKVPRQVYDYLIQIFQGDRQTTQNCSQCQQKKQKIQKRKQEQKQYIIQLENIKSSNYCMISNEWVKRWMSFVYNKADFGYFNQGFPQPGPITNKSLVNGQNCKTNLIKNVDFKVISIYIWKFLKQLYGGGPQIRYKWMKTQIGKSQQAKLQQIKQYACKLKQMYCINIVQSPRKMIALESSTNFVESVKDNSQIEQISQEQHIQQ